MKRQREQAKRERKLEKAAKREQRKTDGDKPAGDEIDMSEVVREGVILDD